MNKNSSRLIGVLIMLLFIIIFILSFPFLESDSVKDFVSKSGMWGLIVVFVYYVLADVIAPLASSPMSLLSIVLYGFPITLLSIYLSSIVSSIICFYISKKYGRELVTKLVGKSGMGKVDVFVEKSGLSLLVLGRLLGGTINELLSYAFGLTKMTFKRYFLITVLLSWVPYGLMFLLFKAFNYSPTQMVSIWIVGVVLLAVIFSFIITKYITGDKGK